MANKTTYEIQAKTKGFKESDSAVKGLNKSLGGLKTAAIGVAGAYFGGQALISGVRASVEAFGQQELAEKKLEQALGTTSTALLNQASALQQVSVEGDEAIIAQQAFLASLDMSEQQIKDILPVALDLAAATGMTLESAVRNTAKTFSGLAGELGELVPQLRDLTAEEMKAGDAVKVMGDLFGGAALAETKTMTGSLSQMGNAVGDASEAIGEVLAPTIIAIAEFVKEAAENFTDFMEDIGLTGSTALQTVEFIDAATKSWEDFNTAITDATMTDIVVFLEQYGHTVDDVNQLQKDLNEGAGELQTTFSGPFIIDFSKVSDGAKITLAQINAIIDRINELNDDENKPKIFSQEEIDNADARYTDFIRKNIEDETERNVALLQVQRDKLTEELEAHIDSKNAIEEVDKIFDKKIDKLREDNKKKIDADKKAQKQADIQSALGDVALAANSFAAIGEAFGANAKFIKNMTIAAAIADALAGANKAFAQGGVMGYITGAGILASGYNNVAQIKQAYAQAEASKQEGAQYGFEGVVDEPTQFTVGEGGQAEYVSVTPMEGVNNAGGGVNIQISGNVMTDEFVEGELAEKIADAVRRGTDFGIS